MKEIKRHKSNAAGFTLVELMVVIAIVAIMATVVGVSVLGQVDDASQKAAINQIDAFKTAIVAFKLKQRRLPQSLEELKPFLDPQEIPKDPWGNDYQYSPEGSSKYTIMSYGADGKSGGSEYDQDISNENMSSLR